MARHEPPSKRDAEFSQRKRGFSNAMGNATGIHKRCEPGSDVCKDECLLEKTGGGI